MECSEINILGCVEQYRETQDDYSCADKKVRCAVQSLQLQPTSNRTQSSSLQGRINMNPAIHSKMKSMSLGDDLLAAGGSVIVRFEHDFNSNKNDKDRKDDRFSVAGKVYDDRYSIEGKISQVFNQDGWGKLDSEIAFNYDDHDKQLNDGRMDDPIRENH